MPEQFEVKLSVKQRSSYLSASSADVPGLQVVGTDEFQLRAVAMRAIKDLFLRNKSQNVDVLPTDDLTVLRVRLAG
jgi:hypothetical protein